MRSAIVLLLLFASCTHTVGRCPERCTPDPVVAGTKKVCVDAEFGRLCGYREGNNPCADFLLRSECGGGWAFQGTECQYPNGERHGT